MGLTLLTERYAPQIAGVLSCFDRLLMFGTLPKVCFADGMTAYLYQHKVRIFYYPRFAEPFRNRLREQAEKLAADNGLQIEHIRKKNFRKENRVKQILAQRGEQPGLVCILSAMEPCATYKPWYDRETGKTYLKPEDGKCLHYYFYFLDEELGLGYVRVPTWLPCLSAGLLQRPQLAGRAIEKARYRLPHAGQCVCRDRRLGPGPAHCGWMAGQADSLEAGRVGETLLPHLPRLRRRLPLEPGPVRVRHRHRLSAAGRVAGYLRQPHAHRHPYRQTGQHRHISG